jgi:uncharacterized protein
MQMILGFFIFTLSTASFDDLDRSTAFKWSAHERIGRRSTHQYLGVDDETISLSGTLYPAFKGSTLSLTLLREMADSGKSWILISGTGNIYGKFMILDIKDKRSLFMSNGAAQKIEFSMTLKRYDDFNDTLESIADALSS